MANQTITKQPVLNIGLAGHIDHGKTTLLWKLTGKWTDTHSEELKRGITIKLGYADCIIKKCDSCNEFTTDENCLCGEKAKPFEYVSFIDVPGHEMLMATMLSGAAIIDAALLVVAANEGIKPQTKEHLIALEIKGIKNIIIVQNKIDLVSKEKALENYHEIKNFVKGTIAENSPIIPVSAQQGVNIGKVLEAITQIKAPERDEKSSPLFFIARSFDINKPGTDISQIRGGVLGGTLKQGVLNVGDEIEIKPGLSIKKHNIVEYKTLYAKILGLHAGNSSLEQITPSGSLSIQTSLDPVLTKADSLAGCVVSKKDSLPQITSEIKVKISLFNEVLGIAEKKAVEPLKPTEYLLLSMNTAITVGLVKKISQNIVELNLKIPVVALKGSRIGIARNLAGHWRLIGYGELL